MFNGAGKALGTAFFFASMLAARDNRARKTRFFAPTA